jgi:hypothetical protein
MDPFAFVRATMLRCDIKLAWCFLVEIRNLKPLLFRVFIELVIFCKEGRTVAGEICRETYNDGVSALSYKVGALYTFDCPWATYWPGATVFLISYIWGARYSEL